MKIYTRNIGLNRGKPRLWLEGAILLTNGFNHEDIFTINEIEDGLLITKVDNSFFDEPHRKIAGNSARPIIDINSGALLSRFNCKVRIIANKGELIVMEV